MEIFQDIYYQNEWIIREFYGKFLFIRKIYKIFLENASFSNCISSYGRICGIFVHKVYGIPNSCMEVLKFCFYLLCYDYLVNKGHLVYLHFLIYRFGKLQKLQLLICFLSRSDRFFQFILESGNKILMEWAHLGYIAKILSGELCIKICL